MKSLSQRRNGFARRRPKNNPVRPVEVFDRASVGEEHRLAHQQALQPFFLQHLFNLCSRTHANRRDNRQHLKAATRARQAEYKFFQSLAGIFGEENYLGPARQFFRVHRIHQPSRTHVAPNHFLKILFKKRYVAFRHFHDARAISMTAANRCAEICEASGDDSCEVAGSINPNLHILSSDQTRSLGSGAWCAARKSMVIRPMDLATGRKYMSCRSVKHAASCGFSWVIADWIVFGVSYEGSLQRSRKLFQTSPPTSGAGDRCG